MYIDEAEAETHGILRTCKRLARTPWRKASPQLRHA
jgi:hypothetical protein